MRLSTVQDFLSRARLRVLANVDEPLYSPLREVGNAWRRFRAGGERAIRLGPRHPDRTFYVLRDLPADVGLASWYDMALGFLTRAERKGWIPVIIPPVPRTGDAPLGGEWDAYFAFPSPYAPDDVLQSAHVVFAAPQSFIHKRPNPREIARRHRLAARIPPNKAMLDWLTPRADAMLATLPPGARVGVYFRGTDYRTAGTWRPVGHPAVPRLDTWCAAVRADLERWGLTAKTTQGGGIFIVTEEQEALDAIRAQFPAARFVEKERFANFRHGVGLSRQRLPHTSPFDNNRLYLLDLHILSRCDYLIGTVNAGLMTALNWNGNAYTGVHVLKTGVT